MYNHHNYTSQVINLYLVLMTQLETNPATPKFELVSSYMFELYPKSSKHH